jgi:hypothetical protein
MTASSNLTINDTVPARSTPAGLLMHALLTAQKRFHSRYYS